MKCFKVVHSALEKIYEKIPGDDEKTRDAAITTALVSLSKTYNTSLLSDGGPDFTKLVNRFAYLYKYMPVRAHWVYELLKSSLEAAEVFYADEVDIACIGGGPGSDLVGILKFLHGREDAPTIRCQIVDGCKQWERTWAVIESTLDQPIRLTTEYIIHRVGESNVPTKPTNFANADLFTMSFFVSEITNMGDPAWDYVKMVLEQAKPGAVLLFNDNNHTSFYEKFDEIAADDGWTVLVKNHGERKTYDPGEDTNDLGRFKHKFGGRAPSQLRGDVAQRVLQKPIKKSRRSR